MLIFTSVFTLSCVCVCVCVCFFLSFLCFVLGALIVTGNNSSQVSLYHFLDIFRRWCKAKVLSKATITETELTVVDFFPLVLSNNQFLLPHLIQKLFFQNFAYYKVNNRNTRTRCKIYSKLTMKTPERCQWGRSAVFIVNFEYISHLVFLFLLLTLNM